MSLRLPQNLDPLVAPHRTADAFNQEVLAEKAYSLGQAGKSLVAKLALLRDATAIDDRTALLKAAADAAHGYFIQRELLGLFAHQSVIDDYNIPREVLARMGAK